MLKNNSIMATLPVVDLQRARKFYEDTLGLGNPALVNEEEVLYEFGQGSKLYLYVRGPTKADHTVFSFLVEDIEKEVKELKNKGIVFAEYDTPTLKTIDSIATLKNAKSAWFKDTEGNIIALSAFFK